MGEQVEPQKVIILLGPPGSGKGTQAKRMAQELGLPHISTGDIFRSIINDDTELARKAKSYMNAGKLVPDELVLEILFERVSRPDSQKGYILDGFPRTIPQAEALDKHLTDTHTIAINIEVSDEEVIKRISGRLSCFKCGRVYNIYFSPPKNEGVCDDDGAELVQRPDDQPNVVRERLEVYHEQTEPLIEYYNKKGVLHNVNGEQPVDQVFQELRNRI